MSTSSESSQRPVIALVSSNEQLRGRFQALLSGRGFRVRAYDSFEEWKKFVGTEIYCGILLDSVDDSRRHPGVSQWLSVLEGSLPVGRVFFQPDSGEITGTVGSLATRREGEWVEMFSAACEAAQPRGLRRFQRVTTHLAIEAQVATESYKLATVDLSEGGMFLTNFGLGKIPPVGSEIRVKFKSKPDLGEWAGRVAWALSWNQMDSDGRLPGIGIEFVENTESRQQLLRSTFGLPGPLSAEEAVVRMYEAMASDAPPILKKKKRH